MLTYCETHSYTILAADDKKYDIEIIACLRMRNLINLSGDGCITGLYEIYP